MFVPYSGQTSLPPRSVKILVHFVKFLLCSSKYVRFEVFTAVTMKNAVFWDIKIQLVPHRRHVTSLLQSLVG
jgi:hypothetical protein